MILAIDDTTTNLEILEDLLEEYDVIPTISGRDALEITNKEKVDLILLDIMMPNMDGYEVCRRLKSDDKTKDIPIIFITAKADEDSIEKAYDMGGTDYITKPFKPKELLSKVKKELQYKQMLEEIKLLAIQDKKELEVRTNEISEYKKAVDYGTIASKSKFLSNMSHEIRTPLNTIMGFIDLLKEEDLNKKSSEYVDMIGQSSQNLLKIIEDILDFSKIESEKLDINKIDFNTKNEFNVVTYLFLDKCLEKDISLTLNIDDKVPSFINTDPLRIKQVIINLLSNAVKFTSEGTRVKTQCKDGLNPSCKNIDVNISYKDKVLKVSVKDNGKGIEKDKLSHIFESFSQEDNSTTREFGGTGIGLSISSQLVKLLGGELKVKSEVGIGSEFYFDIPIGIVKDTVATTTTSSTAINLENKKILLVEDNKANQIFMKIIFKKLKIEFDLANDGLEAIEFFKKNLYDAILMDENMPNMNGIKATKEILAIEKEKNIKHTPIIALTANALKGDRERFLEAGMDEYITKPTNKQKISDILSKILEK